VDDLDGTRPPADELRLVAGFVVHPAAMICAVTDRWIAAAGLGLLGAVLVIGPMRRIARYYLPNLEEP